MNFEVIKILDDLGIQHFPGDKNNIKIKCINPGHNDNDPSMQVHITKGVFHCFACGAKGHVLQLVQDTYKYNPVELFKYAQNFSAGGQATEKEMSDALSNFVQTRSKTIVAAAEPAKVVPPRTQLTIDNAYLLNRGMTPQEMSEWQIGVCLDGPYKNWVYIPILMHGVLRGYFLRSTVDKRKLYGAYPRRDILFGYDQSRDITKPLYLCEGIFDMIFLRRMGVQAVAVLGNQLTPEQKMLLKPYKHIVAVPDIDTNLRGMHMLYHLSELMPYCDIHVMELVNKDPAEATLAELLQADLYKVPMHQYIVQERFLKFMQTVIKPQRRSHDNNRRSIKHNRQDRV